MYQQSQHYCKQSFLSKAKILGRLKVLTSAYKNEGRCTRIERKKKTTEKKSRTQGRQQTRWPQRNTKRARHRHCERSPAHLHLSRIPWRTAGVPGAPAAGGHAIASLRAVGQAPCAVFGPAHQLGRGNPGLIKHSNPHASEPTPLAPNLCVPNRSLALRPLEYDDELAQASFLLLLSYI